MRTALTIAGSDSGGGAGIQADLKTFAAHRRVRHVRDHRRHGPEHPRRHRVASGATDLVIAQIEAVAGDIGADAVKIGMLASAAIVEAVAAAIARARPASCRRRSRDDREGGDRLLRAGGRQRDQGRSAAAGGIVTPNVPEAEVLAGIRIRRRGHARGGDRIRSSDRAS